MNIDDLRTAITANDAPAVLAVLVALQEQVLNDDVLVKELVNPATVDELQKLLIEKMGVNPRTMRLRVRVPHLKRRALLFIQTMTNGVNYLS